MKRKALIKLFEGLKCLSNLRGVKLAYVISKNRHIIEGEIRNMEESVKMTEGYMEYERKRINLCEEYAEKDEQGKPKTRDGRYIGLEGNDKFFERLTKLQDEYRLEIENRVKQLRDYSDFLEEEINLPFERIELSDIPSDVSVEQMDILINFLKENNNGK